MMCATGKWMMDDLVRMEVGWVCFDVLFFISEFHFLFLLIFIFIFAWLSIYVFLSVFPFAVFVSMFVCLLICFVVLFRLYSLFVFIYYLCYVTVLYQFFFESILCSKMRLSSSVCLLIDCIRCILKKNIVISCCCLFVFIFKIANFEKYSKIVCIARRYFVVDKTVFTYRSIAIGLG